MTKLELIYVDEKEGKSYSVEADKTEVVRLGVKSASRKLAKEINNKLFEEAN